MMVVNDIGKLMFLLASNIGLTLLVTLGNATFEQVEPLYLLSLGYIVGNGVGAVRKRAPSPALLPHVGKREIVTIQGPKAADVHPSGADDAWPDPNESRFFTDDEGNL